MNGNTLDRNSLLARLIGTEPDVTATILRFALGIMIIPHGAQKLLGWFGGYGFDGTMGYFTQTLGIPYVFGLLAILLEFFGGIALILGLFGRAAAVGVGSVLLTAAAITHLGNGFFMNWSGSQGGEGFEFHILAVAIAVVVAIKGSGRFSIDRLLSAKSSPVTIQSPRNSDLATGH